MLAHVVEKRRRRTEHFDGEEDRLAGVVGDVADVVVGRSAATAELLVLRAAAEVPRRVAVGDHHPLGAVVWSDPEEETGDDARRRRRADATRARRLSDRRQVDAAEAVGVNQRGVPAAVVAHVQRNRVRVRHAHRCNAKRTHSLKTQ